MKEKFANLNVLYPMPTVIIGALVNGRANFNTLAHVGVVHYTDPHLISLSMHKHHYTNSGIRENKTFSVNIPSQEMMVETDYVGLVSGEKVDKSTVFETFFGELKTAPMLVKCPAVMECKLYSIVDTPDYDIFIGEIVATYVESEALTNGAVDLAKVRPLLFDRNGCQYWTIGEPVGRCYEVGNQYAAEKIAR